MHVWINSHAQNGILSKYVTHFSSKLIFASSQAKQILFQLLCVLLAKRWPPCFCLNKCYDLTVLPATSEKLVKYHTHERNDFPVAICSCNQQRKPWKALPCASMPKHQTPKRNTSACPILRERGCKHPGCLKLLYHGSEINSANFSERIEIYTFREKYQLFRWYMVTLPCEQEQP